MIATWMAAATLFTLLLGVAAVAIERALRTLGREARGPWLAALAAAITWPVVAPMAAALLAKLPSNGASVAITPAQSAIGTITATVPPLPGAWIPYVDGALVTLWAIASVLLLGRLVFAMRALSRVERSATEEVLAGVPVLVTPALGPAVFGVRRPRVLLPRWLLDLDAPLRALVLRHEQEHSNARDAQLTLAVAVAVALVPWNVGAWWIARRLRVAVELDCDARVLRSGEDATRYGRLLLLIAQRQSKTTLAPMLAESNSLLSRRITTMNAARPTHATARVALLALVAALALACSTKYATDLTTASSGRSLSTSQGATYYQPDGAKPAALAGRPAVPQYPSDLRSSRVEGEVLVMFVVDTSGLVVTSSLKVVRSTNDLFTEAVRATLPTIRFVPAEFNGRKVKQLVQQPYYFDVRGSAASAARKTPGEPIPTSDPTNRSPMTLRPIVVTLR